MKKTRWFRAFALIGSVCAVGACSDKIDPRDDELPAIPPGVSVQPLRSAPATGGLEVTGQTETTANDTTGAVTGDTTTGVRS